MDTPLITIIIPTYNRADLIGEAIGSVLVQTYSNWELLVIDDASTDETETVVADYIKKDSDGTNRISYIKNVANLGISKTRNRGLREARGEYIAMLDSDDVWLDREKLAKQIEAFQKNPSTGAKPLGIVGTWITFIDESGKPVKNGKQNASFAQSDADIRRTFLYKNHIMQSSVLFLKKAALDAGGYDETMATMEDHDLWLNIGTRYAIETLPIYATGYRIHAGSVSKSRRLRVACDEMTVIRRWKKSYPGFIRGMMKGYVRLLRAYF